MAGADCEANGECGAGLTCVAKKCAARGAADAACEGEAACLESLRCIAGKCGSASANGGPCEQANDCADANADCHVLAPGAAATCHVGKLPVGAPCEATYDCEDVAYCRADAAGAKA